MNNPHKDRWIVPLTQEEESFVGRLKSSFTLLDKPSGELRVVGCRCDSVKEGFEKFSDRVELSQVHIDSVEWLKTFSSKDWSRIKILKIGYRVRQ